MTSRPFVLVIDDDDQEAFALQLGLHGVEASHVFPDAITDRDLGRADLLLIDEFITDWDAREAVRGQPGLFVRDGIALSGVLRAHLERRGPSIDNAPTASRAAMVLRTGHLPFLAAGTPSFMRQVAVSSAHDLEWATEKQATPAHAYAELAHATASLPDSWDPSVPDPQLSWLKLPNRPWRGLALIQIEQCRPPWSALAATSAGRVWLSWFLQQILPFPTFLIDDLRAAASLGLTVGGLSEFMGGSSDLARELRHAVYEGQLKAFDGRRWWRAAIATLRRELAVDAGGHTSVDIAGRLAQLHGGALATLEVAVPVFPIDEEYRTIPEPIEMADAVRLQPDGWPVFADTPWMAISDLGHDPGLARLVVIQDRY